MSGEGGPLPASGHMPFPTHRNCAGELQTGVIAIYRPRANEIALFVEDGAGRSAVALSLSEARAVYDALDHALKLADCRDNPISALTDFRPVKGSPV